MLYIFVVRQKNTLKKFGPMTWSTKNLSVKKITTNVQSIPKLEQLSVKKQILNNQLNIEMKQLFFFN